MSRRCERPGCSDQASIAYGMSNDTLTVWLQAVPDDAAPVRTGMLCRRHADAMIVPRGWTLDDQRESTPRLFRVAAALPATSSSRRKRPVSDGGGEQLTFGEDPLPGDPEQTRVVDLQPHPIDPDETQAIPWRFEYDPSRNHFNIGIDHWYSRLLYSLEKRSN